MRKLRGLDIPGKTVNMKTRRILIGVTAAAIVAGVIIKVAARRRHRTGSKRLSMIAEEGYETAHDILFPRKRKEINKLKYGPVLPE